MPSSDEAGEELKPRRWVSLADRLNPNRAAFDPAFKVEWKTMPKAEKKRIIAEDKRAIRALQQRSSTELPFAADPDDHCETSPTAYKHIAPLLELIAEKLDKSPSDLRIYDPYYCAGGMKRHLDELGFPHVYNKAEDFYEIIKDPGRIPPHDVIVTNPPYSGDHFDKLLTFLRQYPPRPALLLVPDHFKLPSHYAFLTPPQRYHYWTPQGMRDSTSEKKKNNKKKKKHSNLFLGERNSPFASHWCISLEPILKKKQLLHTTTVELVEGCRLHAELGQAQDAAPKFSGTEERTKKLRTKK